MSGSQKCVSYPGVGTPYNPKGQTFDMEYLLNRWTKQDGEKNGLANVGSGVSFLASDLL
jgi:hypothetical protein